MTVQQRLDRLYFLAVALVDELRAGRDYTRQLERLEAALKDEDL